MEPALTKEHSEVAHVNVAGTNSLATAKVVPMTP